MRGRERLMRCNALGPVRPGGGLLGDLFLKKEIMQSVYASDLICVSFEKIEVRNSLSSWYEFRREMDQGGGSRGVNKAELAEVL